MVAYPQLDRYNVWLFSKIFFEIQLSYHNI